MSSNPLETQAQGVFEEKNITLTDDDDDLLWKDNRQITMWLLSNQVLT